MLDYRKEKNSVSSENSRLPPLASVPFCEKTSLRPFFRALQSLILYGPTPTWQKAKIGKKIPDGGTKGIRIQEKR
jgi:hypothetical protein